MTTKFASAAIYPIRLQSPSFALISGLRRASNSSFQLDCEQPTGTLHQYCRGGRRLLQGASELRAVSFSQLGLLFGRSSCVHVFAPKSLLTNGFPLVLRKRQLVFGSGIDRAIGDLNSLTRRRRFNKISLHILRSFKRAKSPPRPDRIAVGLETFHPTTSATYEYFS